MNLQHQIAETKQDLLDFLKLTTDFNEVWLETNNIFHFSHELTSIHMFPTILQDHLVYSDADPYPDTDLRKPLLFKKPRITG